MTNQPPKPRRRWFQFSMRTLLIVVMLVAGLLVAWRVYVDDVEPYRRQRETMVMVYIAMINLMSRRRALSDN